MDTLEVFLKMRNHLRGYYVRAAEQGAKFRDGTAKATWLDDTIIYEFENHYAWLTLYWLLTDSSKTIITEADFTGVDTAELTSFGILGRSTFAGWISGMSERDRTKLLAFFRADMSDSKLDVQQKLTDIRKLVNEVQVIANGLVSRSGGPQTIKYENIGGLKRPVGKTFNEMSLNGAPLANKLLELTTKISEVIRV